MRKYSFLLIFFCLSASNLIADPKPLIIEHGRRDTKNIAITFDACPTSKLDEYDDKVVEVLLREKVPATIFMSGRWVEKNQDKAKLLASNPQFEIAEHSYYHPHMLQKPDDRDKREFARTQALIRKVTGVTPRYFRPPFGEVDERLAELAAEAGLITIQYDIASGDPDPGLSGDRIARYVLREAKGGSIIVFHMNRNGVHTAEALPKVIEGLRHKGYNLVTVGQLLQEENLQPGRIGNPQKQLVSNSVGSKPSSHVKGSPTGSL